MFFHNFTNSFPTRIKKHKERTLRTNPRLIPSGSMFPGWIDAPGAFHGKRNTFNISKIIPYTSQKESNSALQPGNCYNHCSIPRIRSGGGPDVFSVWESYTHRTLHICVVSDKLSTGYPQLSVQCPRLP